MFASRYAAAHPDPENTTFVSIKSGNHGLFGSYGMQKGDSAPKVT
ncbi:alpha/beta hydrolase [Paenibacillus pabuli]|nr:alpha/beta hydrolase [Paenibacillus pabuli]MEC0128373.1 alpha/beta hydrolase [Paenibacillus pabuli]